jgi:nucleotide-binding universal stress UspA family protein
MQRIVVGFDSSDQSRKALERAADLLNRAEAVVSLFERLRSCVLSAARLRKKHDDR